MKSFILLTTLFFFCGTLTTTSVHAAIEGDDCADDNACQSTTTFLTCGENGKCVCQEAPATYFDTADGKCHRFVGDTCVFQTGMPCSLNGVCPPGLVCQCNGGYSTTETKKCAHLYGGLCTVDYNCDRDNFMRCITVPGSRTCGCDPDTSIVDAEHTKCLLFLNQPCIVGSQECVEGSECTGGTDDLKCRCDEGTSENQGQCQYDFGKDCDDTHICNTAKFLKCGDEGTCTCDDEFVDVGSGVCQASYNHVCKDDGSTCNQQKFLVCNEIAGACKCHADLIDMDNNGDCRAIFGADCAPNGIGKPKCEDATLFLDCVNNQCQCKSGLVDNGKGECRVPHGGSCGNGEICDERNNLFCDKEGTNTCLCTGTLTLVGKKCVAAFGEDCKDEEIPVPCNSAKFLDCSSENKCACADGLIDLGDGDCRTDFDGPCGAASAPCNEKKFHKCVDDKCACRPELESIGGGECRTKIDGACDVPDQPKCDENNYLECNHDVEDTPVCACQEKWAPVDGLCKAGAGMSCDAGEPCNSAKYLDCRPNEAGGKTCQCQTDLVDNGVGDCRLTFGGDCATIQDLTCDENTFLTCSDVTGKCACGTDSVYDWKAKSCFLAESATCTAGSPPDRIKCAPHSYCYSTTLPTGECRCQGGLQPNLEGRCFAAGGATCDPFQDLCDYSEFQQCAVNTATQHYTCSCIPNDFLIEESVGRCRLQADSPCDDALGSQQCTTDATCRDVAGELWCVCADGLIVNDVGKCVIAYGHTCGPEAVGTCDGERFQSCHIPEGSPDGQCQCSDLANMVYDNHEIKCFVKAGSPCVQDSLMHCVDHSTCNSDHVCSCDTNFVDDGHGRCVSQHVRDILFSGLFWREWSHHQSYANLVQ